MSLLETHLKDTYQYLFDVAHQGLMNGVSFVPFGAGVRKTGEQIRTQLDLKWEDSHPQDHITGLIKAFQHDDRVSGLMAAGVVADAAAGADRLDERALLFHLEAANGRAVQVLVHYFRREEDGRIHFADPITTEVPPEIFLNILPE
jgi:hypothetical protein